MPEQINLTKVAKSICSSLGYTFVDKVGEGGFKETFSILEGDNQYALKIYKSEEISSRSEREISVMKRCDHQNIAKVIDIDTVSYKGSHYLFLLEEYLGGGSLNQRVNSNGNLSIREVLDYGENIIQAIIYMKKENLVHRDIKPANILFRAGSDQAVLTDFGIVRDLSATSETKSWLPSGPGTPKFAAPEQLNNEKRLIDWRTDQFSLGITTFFTIFGKHPYQHEGYTILQTIEEVAVKGTTSHFFRQKIERANLSILNRMVSAWPVNRYLSPEDLLRDWIKLRSKI